jgi:2'-5' RNA ligase
MPRLFFALWPDQVIRNEIHAIAEQFPRGKGRLVPTENIHITLAFLGQVGEQQCLELQSQAARIRTGPFDLSLEQLGWWKRSRILWLGTALVPGELERLVNAIKSMLKSMDMAYSIDKRKFIPHVTLIRDIRKPELSKPITPVCWNVDRFVLVKSVTEPSGASYELVDEWKLGG